MSPGAASSSDLSPEYALLGFLYFEPLHGYELHRRLEANLREVWRIPQNQAYNILKRLEKEGLVSTPLVGAGFAPAPAPTNPPGTSGGRSRAVLGLTPAGKAAFEAWLMAPTPGSARAIRVEFLTRLFFASQISPDLAPRLIQEQAARARADLERLQARLETTPQAELFNRLGLELRIQHMLVLVEWLENSHAHFEEM
jgi:PadR family transcriptional regulator, regulatory protein AphA